MILLILIATFILIVAAAYIVAAIEVDEEMKSYIRQSDGERILNDIFNPKK